MEKKIEKVAILLIAIFMPMLVASTYPASAATVSIENVTVREGENTVVPIWINNTVDAAKGATINLTYNASMVHVIDFGNSGFNFEVYNEINNITGYFLYGVANTPSGLTGDIKFVEVTLKAVGNAEDQSPLNLTVLSLNNGTGPDSIPRDVINGTFTIIEKKPPIVANPTANPLIIPEDTDGVPLWGETSNLSVVVMDEHTISNVTINLSSIGGSATQEMTRIGVSNVWNVSTSASIGSAIIGSYAPHQLQVNAIDEYSNSNISVCINLTVMKNGDVDSNEVVNLNDGIYLTANTIGGIPGYDIPEDILVLADVDGNGIVNLNDGIYLTANTIGGIPGYEILQ